jgi:hypothetical protein
VSRGAADSIRQGTGADDLKLVPRAAYDEILKTLVTYPIKEVKIFQPGPWGAYRYATYGRSRGWSATPGTSWPAPSWP